MLAAWFFGILGRLLQFGGLLLAVAGLALDAYADFYLIPLGVFLGGSFARYVSRQTVRVVGR
jgi:hypothetical protein